MDVEAELVTFALGHKVFDNGAAQHKAAGVGVPVAVIMKAVLKRMGGVDGLGFGFVEQAVTDALARPLSKHHYQKSPPTNQASSDPWPLAVP